MITDTYDYNAYGTILDQSGSTANSYLYTGEQFDSALDNYYLRARYYDPSNGRFTAMDSFQGRVNEPVTLHKYLYGNGDPANFTDPTGNFSLASFGTATNIRATLTTTSVPNYSAFLVRAVLATATASAGLFSAHSQISKTTIRKCIESSRSGTNKCKPEIPIFVVGDSHNEIRDHVADAQAGGSPSVVTRRARAYSRGWITRLKQKGVVCQGGSGTECDEYPMAIHEEGGPYRNTSLRSVNAFQNGSIGGMVSQFHRRCKVDVGKKYKFVAVQGIPISGGICK